MLEVSLPTSILENQNKRDWMPDLLAFLNSIQMTPDERAARIQREMAQLAVLPDELAVRVDIAGREYVAQVMDLEVLYGVHVAARLAKEPGERDYLRAVRSWLNRALTEEAEDEGVEVLPLFGFREVVG